MCIGKGMIAVKGMEKLLYEIDSNDHSPIIQKNNLKDDTLINRSFVRLEILPLGSLTSLELKDWKIRVDEEGTLPSWFEEEKEIWKTRTLDTMLDIIIPSWIEDGINGSLDLQGTQVKDLGKLEKVNGSLYLQGTQVKDLGNLKECVSLYLQGTQVKDLGNLKECVSLYLQGTQVKDLGKLEKVNGYLDLQGTQVKDLGKLEKVNGSLYLQGTQVKDLGNLKECGYLYLQGTQVKDLGNLKECVYLYLQGTQVIKGMEKFKDKIILI